MQNKTLCYFPAMHPELVDPPLNGAVAFLPCGLPHAQKEHGNTIHTCETATPFPFAPKEAAYVLREMLSLGSEMAHKDVSGLIALEKANPVVPFFQGRSDREDLRTFSETGTFSNQKSTEETARTTLMDCQKFLMLSFHLEENHLEILATQQTLASSTKALSSLLAQDIDTDDTLPSSIEAASFTEENSPPSSSSWKQLLEAAAPFLGNDVIFITQDSIVIEEIQTKFAPLPLTDDQIALLKQKNIQPTTCLGLSLPLWQLTGRKTPEENKPWLNRYYTIILIIQRDKLIK